MSATRSTTQFSFCDMLYTLRSVYKFLVGSRSDAVVFRANVIDVLQNSISRSDCKRRMGKEESTSEVVHT